jgi:hypothetical protein
MPAVDITSVLTQLPLVGLFVWFILERDKRQAVTETRRDDAWREFIKEQRGQANEAIGRIADEVKALAQQTSAMSAILIAHDTRAAAIEAVYQIRQQIQQTAK